MTECTYPATTLYGLADGECGQDVRWRMVAGTTACPGILEFRLCSVHAAACAAAPDLPSRLRDSHGHRMEEAILRDLEDPGGGDIVLVNSFVYPVGACACGVCHSPYLSVAEGAACGYRDRRMAGYRDRWMTWTAS